MKQMTNRQMRGMESRDPKRNM